jgi:hypothetical protein
VPRAIIISNGKLGFDGAPHELRALTRWYHLVLRAPT